MESEKKEKEINKEEASTETTKGPLTDLEVAKKMLNLKQSADSRNIKFDLSFVTLKELMEQKK